MIARPALLLVLASACGGAGGTTTHHAQTTSRPRAGSADVAAMRALLERRSPTGHYIVSTYERLPSRFVFGQTTIDVHHGGGFGDYLTDGSPESVVNDLSTAVHEVYHAYAGTMQYELLQRSHAAPTLHAEAVYVGRGAMLVTYTALYPARRMDATYPADARTSRYATYVSPSQPQQSTQVEGVYGLLDEMTAYYHSSRTIVDLWPWLRDEAPASEQIVINYVSRFHEMWVPYAEFRLFILHYLRHARDHEPDVYAAVMGNDSFRRAFAACDDAYAALLADATVLEPTIHAFARSRGVKIGLAAGQITFAGSPWNVRDEAYAAVMRHLASKPYAQLLAEVRR